MRQKRAKAYRKLMHVYCMSFGFRQPYQVLVDAEMCSEVISSKMDFPKQLATVLQGGVKPMITQCSIHSLYLAGRTAQPAVDLAKTFERRRCNHREAKPEEECVKEVIGSSNIHRYVLAAQSTSLRQHVRQVPGTPIIHVKRSVMVLEPASNATEKAKFTMEDDRMRPTEAETSTIAATLATSSTTGGNKSNVDPSAPPKKKSRGPKGPNPLSVKKKRPKENERRSESRKPKGDTSERSEAAGEKRKRRDDANTGDDGGVNETSKEGMELAVKRTRNRNRKRKRTGEEHTEVETGKNDDAGT